jgi:hypothetical protein
MGKLSKRILAFCTVLILLAVTITGCSKGATTAEANKRDENNPGYRNNMETVMPDIAKILNMDQTELNTQLQAGKKLSEIATAKGVSVETLTKQIKTLLDAQTDKEVQEGKLTSEQAVTRKEQNTQMADNIVNGTRPSRPDNPSQGDSKQQL